jgi:hypothetical protein
MDEALVMSAKSRRRGGLADAHQRKKREVQSTELGPAPPLVSAYIAIEVVGWMGQLVARAAAG